MGADRDETQVRNLEADQPYARVRAPDVRKESMTGGFRITISVKLVLMTVGLILAVVLPIAIHTSDRVESSVRSMQDEINLGIAKSKVTEAENLFLAYLQKIKLVHGLMLAPESPQTKAALDIAFFQDPDLVNVEIYNRQDTAPKRIKRETNQDYLVQFEKDATYVERIRRERPIDLSAVFGDGKIRVQNSSLKDGLPLFTLLVPVRNDVDVVHQVIVADVRLDRLQKSFVLPGVRTIYLVDQSGTLLAHSNDQLALAATNLGDVKIVAQAIRKQQGPEIVIGTRYVDPLLSEEVYGTWARTNLGLTVVAQVPERVIQEQPKQVKTESFKVAGYVLSGAFFLVILLALTLTGPIERLHEATVAVAQGDFTVKAQVNSNDEVGDLAHGFNLMVGGLRERDKVKTILNKFHGSSITASLLQEDLVLGGSRKNVVIFFSDIRGFTKFSEGHTPEEVVEMLNEYFQIMVSIITSHHGIVDKFVGDAIMAVWGAPQSSGDDAYWALKACLEMRRALEDLNLRRQEREQPPLMIGMGLHTGAAISGTIGSTERMEYTVIGDTVNMASRIESSTKAFGADLLVSDSIAQQVESRFVLEEAGAAEVKGKSEAIRLYKVRGFVDEAGNVDLVQTPYSDYEPEASEKVKVA